MIDANTLAHGVHNDTVCEFGSGTSIPVQMARRLLCEAAEIYVANLDGERVLLNLGRSKRQASREQRRALRTQYTTCAFDDCTVGFSKCEVHHVEFFEREGPTDYANLVPLCGRHHHLVHEGRWRLAIDRTRTITIFKPDGKLHAEIPFVPSYRPRHRREHRPPEQTRIPHHVS